MRSSACFLEFERERERKRDRLRKNEVIKFGVF